MPVEVGIALPEESVSCVILSVPCGMKHDSALKPPRYTMSGYATFYANGTTAMRLPRGTTVIICGDARTNYRPDGLDALKAIAAQSRRVFWLNPEPEAETRR